VVSTTGAELLLLLLLPPQPVRLRSTVARRGDHLVRVFTVFLLEESLVPREHLIDEAVLEGTWV
jgi:hypothetical protein